MISFRQKGDFSKTMKFLEKSKNCISINDLNRYGEKGVSSLSAATPKDTGLTASSWIYKINQTKTSISLSFYNTNIQNGVPIAIVLQYGHATGNGYWVEGVDYINPTLKPIFDEIANEVWERVKKS